MKQFLENFSKVDIRNIIAVIFTVASFVYIYALIFKKIPPENAQLINVLGGSVLSGLLIIIGYYFGSSKAGNSSQQ